jgi:spermidine synthase
VPRPSILLERVQVPEGSLELRQRDERDFMITINGRVLMSSIIHRSEVALAELACAPIRQRPAPRVLLGGMGLGYTLRAALDALPETARVQVAELNAAVKRWCEGPLADLTGRAALDRRVTVVIEDVSASVRRAARPGAERLDAIIVDLYEGPRDLKPGQHDALYGTEILRHTHTALNEGGVYAVWAEEPNPAFEHRLRAVGFGVEYARVRGGGPRHAVYVARKIARGTPQPVRKAPPGRRAGPASRSRRARSGAR